MQPSVGRIVHYQSSRHRPQAAIITDVHADGAASLIVFVPGKGTVELLGVPFTDVPEVHCWSWPPRV